jgi:hypothetical protein
MIINIQLEKTLKDCDKEEILVTRNMDLQKKLEQLKITDKIKKY